MHTPRKCHHTPRAKSTFEAGGVLGEPFIGKYRSGVYFNRRAEIPDEVTETPGANVHLPAAYAVLRKFLDDDELQKVRTMIVKPLDGKGKAGGNGGPVVHKYAKSLPMLERALPDLFARLYALRDAFGRYIELDAVEAASATLCDVRCVRYFSGDECPWHREDARSHFVAMVLLSDPLEDFEGGTMMVHGGTCPSDQDAMPISLEAGDAIIFTAPRIDHALQQVEAGERAVAMFEFARDGDATVV